MNTMTYLTMSEIDETAVANVIAALRSGHCEDAAESEAAIAALEAGGDFASAKEAAVTANAIRMEEKSQPHFDKLMARAKELGIELATYCGRLAYYESRNDATYAALAGEEIRVNGRKLQPWSDEERAAYLAEKL